jgi:hypothetical protein
MIKKVIIVFLVIFSITSCKKEINEPIAAPTIQEEMVPDESEIVCYQCITKQDTINLRLFIENSVDVKGELTYLFFEKDKNYGTIVGKMIGDTLKADYTFMSEGKQSFQQVVFLRKGKIMIEAYGDVAVVDGKTIFEEPTKLYFDSATVLMEVDCIEPK